MKRLLLAATALALVSPALAQTRQPAQVTTIPSANPQPVDVLDTSGAWATIGTIDPTTHAFTPSTGSGGGGAACGTDVSTPCFVTDPAPVAPPNVALDATVAALGPKLDSINTHVQAPLAPGSLVTTQLLIGGVITTPSMCGSSAYKHVASASDQVLVAYSGTKTIYICDYAISFGGTVNVYLESATATACGGTLTQIAQTWYGIAAGGKVAANPFYRGLSATGGLCVNASSAGPFDITVYYDQY